MGSRIKHSLVQGFYFLSTAVEYAEIILSIGCPNPESDVSMRIKGVWIITQKSRFLHWDDLFKSIVCSAYCEIIQHKQESFTGDTADGNMDLLILIGSQTVNIFSPSVRGFKITSSGNNGKILRISTTL